MRLNALMLKKGEPSRFVGRMFFSPVHDMRNEELFKVRPFLPEETFLLVTSLSHGAYALVWGSPSTA